MKSPRGTTLVELMVSMVIMVVAVALAASLLVEGSRLSRNGEETVEANDSARQAGEAVAGMARLAGMGAPGGVWVSLGGTPTLISPVFGSGSVDGGGDDLWMVVPHRNAMRETCQDPGAAVTVQAAGPGVINTNCIASIAVDAGLLMATNMTTGALLSAPTLTAGGGVDGGRVDYAESATPGFSDSPQKGGFQVGDLVFPVTVVHYYLVTTAGSRRLMQGQGTLGTSSTAPFVDDGTGAVEVQRDIEDFRVAYGVDPSNGSDPAAISDQLARAPAYAPGLRSVRLSVVAVAKRTALDGQGNPVATPGFGRLGLEGDPDGPLDGRRRTIYSRRVELPNLAPGNL